MKRILLALLLISSVAEAQRTIDLSPYTGNGIDSAYFNGYINNTNRKILGVDIGKKRTDSLANALKDTVYFDTVDIHSVTVIPRIGTITTSSNPTPNINESDQYNITDLAEDAAIGTPTGSPGDGQILTVRIKDNGTARALSWSTVYRGSTNIPLPTTTIAGKTMYLLFLYNAAAIKWDCITLTQDF